jgi:hypothetical protein
MNVSSPFPVSTPRAAPSSVASLRRLLVLSLGAVACAASVAQPAPVDTRGAESAPPTRLAVGDATSQLLALQRSGAAASTVPRPIPGPVAARSYQRYLKSFDHPIPERFDTTVGGGAAAGSSPR